MTTTHGDSSLSHQMNSLTPARQRLLLTVAIILVTALIGYFFLFSLVFLIVTFTLAWYGIDLVRKRTEESVDPSGKYVFITGCDSGFGLESAKALRDQGFGVIAGCLNDNSPGAKELRARPWVKKVEVVSVDVSSEASVQACAEEIRAICGDQGLWAVINNAGINCMGPVELVTMEMFHRCAEVNLFGAIRVTKSLLPLIRQAQGRIVNTTSERAFNPYALSAPYCLTKAGLESFSDCLRKEMSEFKVKVSTIIVGEFGGSTAILDPEKTERLQEELAMSRSSLPLQDQNNAVYSQHKLAAGLKKIFQGAMQRSGSSVQPVMDAYSHAVSSTDPLNHYLVHGMRRQYLDPLILMIRCRPFLPEVMLGPVERALHLILG